MHPLALLQEDAHQAHDFKLASQYVRGLTHSQPFLDPVMDILFNA